jgi:molybdate transport system ATP-binding protein
MSAPARLVADFSVDLPADRAGGVPTTVEARLDLPGDGGVTILFGPSGCGKTTVLRCLAGLTRPARGRIVLGAECWADAATGVCLSPQARDVGMHFQDPALFPWLDVAGNVGFGLARLPTASRAARVAAALARYGILDLAARKPVALSGGQQQRVALARALVRPCRILLLDEPLSAVDSVARAGLWPRLREDLLATGVPAVVVTHDHAEARALGDTIAVMDRGRVLHAGPVAEVFRDPLDAATERFAAAPEATRD